ncbi:MAG: STAS domain-containing protein [Mycobacterium sp.]
MPAAQGDPASHAERPGFRIQKTVSSGVVVLSVEDVVDLLTAPLLDATIGDELRQGPTGLVVDLTAVTFLASAGMTTLVKAHEQAGTAVSFAVVANGPTTSRPLKLLGLDATLALYPTLDDALRELR